MLGLQIKQSLGLLLYLKTDILGCIRVYLLLMYWLKPTKEHRLLLFDRNGGREN